MPQYDWNNFDCRICGACCQHFKAVNVELDDPHFEFLRSRNLIEHSSEFDTHVMKKTAKDSRRCVALAGGIGIDASCSIYENRPQSCRNFEATEHRCRTARFVQITRELGVELPKPAPCARRSKFIEQWLAAP